MGVFYYYHVSEDDKRQRMDRPRDLLNHSDEHYKNIAYYFLDSDETYPCYVAECGEEYSTSCKKVVGRVNFKNSYLHYVFGGKGYFNGIPLTKGNVFISWAGQTHSILTDADDPLKFYYLGISGYNHEAYLTALGFDRQIQVFDCDYFTAVDEVFKSILYKTAPEVNQTAYTMGKCLMLLSRHRPSSPHQAENEAYHQVALAKQLMAQSRYCRSINDIASDLCISRKHFAFLFKSVTGISPRDYILEQRMTLAKNYLANGYSVNEVTEMLEYCDYAAFFNAFQKSQGLTPKEYVNSMCKKESENQNTKQYKNQ